MPRPKIHDVPMPNAARRVRSDAEKIARGERRVTTWISADAAKALDKLTGGSSERGAIQAALNEALIGYTSGGGRQHE